MYISNKNKTHRKSGNVSELFWL